MLNLNNLPVYDSFAQDCANKLALGDFSEKKCSFGLPDLEPNSQLYNTLKHIYNVLGVPTNQPFATVQTKQAMVKKGFAYTPCIYKDQEGQISIQWGYTFIPISFSQVPPVDKDSKTFDATFWFYGHEGTAQSPFELTYQFNMVKDFATRKEFPNLSLVWTFDLPDGTQESIAFKVIYRSDCSVEQKTELQTLIQNQYSLRKDAKKAAQNAQKINDLLGKVIKTTALPVMSPSANLNKLFLSQFEKGFLAEDSNDLPVIIPFTGFAFKASENPYYLIDVSLDKVIERLGDYEIEGFGKKPVKVSEVSRLAINADNYLGREFDGKQSQSGIIIVKNASENINHIPQCMVLFSESMSDEVKAIHGSTQNALSYSDQEINEKFDDLKRKNLKALEVNPSDLI